MAFKTDEERRAFFAKLAAGGAGAVVLGRTKAVRALSGAFKKTSLLQLQAAAAEKGLMLPAFKELPRLEYAGKYAIRRGGQLIEGAGKMLGGAATYAAENMPTGQQKRLFAAKEYGELAGALGLPGLAAKVSGLPARVRLKENLKNFLVRKFSREALPVPTQELVTGSTAKEIGSPKWWNVVAKAKPFSIEQYAEKVADELAGLSIAKAARQIKRTRTIAVRAARVRLFGGVKRVVEGGITKEKTVRGLLTPVEERIGRISVDRTARIKLRKALASGLTRRARTASGAYHKALKGYLSR